MAKTQKKRKRFIESDFCLQDTKKQTEFQNAKEKYTLLDFHLHFQVLIHIFEPKVYFIGLMALQEVMKSRRKTLSLSQQDLAEMAGIGLSTIKDIERGQGNPSLATISKILEVLGMEMVFKVRQTV